MSDLHTNEKSDSRKISVGRTVLQMIILTVVLRVLYRAADELSEKLSVFTSWENHNGIYITLSLTVIAAALIFVARKKKLNLSVFPEDFRLSRCLIIAWSVILSIIFMLSGFLFYSCDPLAGLWVIGSFLVIPVFDVLLFQGLIWACLKKTGMKETGVFFLSVLFFSVWHFDEIILSIVMGTWDTLLWQLAMGLSRGLFLGLIRLKAENCCLPMLLNIVLTAI